MIFPKLLFSFLVLSCTAITSMNENLPDERIDEIIATIYTKEGVELILRSDLRLGLDGQPRNLLRAILERLMVCDALGLRVTITDADVDRFLEQLQRQNGVTRSAIDAMLREMGYSPEEGRTELRRKQMIDVAVDYRVRGAKELVVDQSAIDEYDDQNPIMSEPIYTLAQAYIPVSDITREELDERVGDSEYCGVLRFDPPFTVPLSNIPEDRQDALNNPVGSIIEIDEVDGYFELTKLVAVTPATRIPVSPERAREIEMILKRDKYAQILRDYENKLLADASIVFTYPEDRLTVYSPDRLPDHSQDDQ